MYLRKLSDRFNQENNTVVNKILKYSYIAFLWHISTWILILYFGLNYFLKNLSQEQFRKVRVFIIVFCSLWIIIFFYFLRKFAKDIIRQIVFGESKFGEYAFTLMQWTKNEVKSRSLLLMWLIKIFVTVLTIMILSLLMRYNGYINTIYDKVYISFLLLFVYCFGWLSFLLYSRPFKHKNENFVWITDLLAITLMILMFSIYRFNANNEEVYGYFKIGIFTLGMCLPGTYILIVYKIILVLQRILLILSPKIQRLSVLIYKWFRFLCCKLIFKKKRTPQISEEETKADMLYLAELNTRRRRQQPLFNFINS